jgi:hypothetical protein
MLGSCGGASPSWPYIDRLLYSVRDSIFVNKLHNNLNYNNNTYYYQSLQQIIYEIIISPDEKVVQVMVVGRRGGKGFTSNGCLDGVIKQLVIGTYPHC